MLTEQRGTGFLTDEQFVREMAVLWSPAPPGERGNIADDRIRADRQARIKRVAELEAALRTIAGPASEGSPYIEVYRAAGGGYEGLQAVASAVLGKNSEPTP